MKKPILYLSTLFVLVLSGIYLSSCGNHGHDHNNHEHSTEEGSDYDNDTDHKHEIVYQCPMQCEGEKTYTEAGNCPSCEMELEKIEDHEH